MKNADKKEQFINKQLGTRNQDIDLLKNIDYYINLAKDWEDDLPPIVIKHVDGFNIIDEAELHYGSKARFGDLLISKIKQEELVYVAPRFGWAPMSLTYLAKKHNKRLTLFMPACKEVSEHQLVSIESGAKIEFRRIAAMPNLNLWASQYAQANGAFFIPLGLKHELVTAGAIKVIRNLFKDKPHPKEMWSVISTGVLTRALQIALPDTEFHAVAVARNIQDGELGRAKFYSYHKIFAADAETLPTQFESASNYDAKGYEVMKKFGSPGAYFYNVAGLISPKSLQAKDVDSYRPWPTK